MFIYSGEVIFSWSQELLFITTREELKKDTAREEFKNLTTQGWRRTEEDWTKTENQGC